MPFDAGGAGLDNARRSGPVAVTFRTAIGAFGAPGRPAWLARGARDPRCVTAGCVLRRGTGGIGAAGSGPRRCCAIGKCCHQTLSPQSRKDARATLRAALTCAVEEEIIAAIR